MEQSTGSYLPTAFTVLLALLGTGCAAADDKCGASSCSDGFKCCGGEICVSDGEQCPSESTSQSPAPDSPSSGDDCDYSGCLEACYEAGGSDCGELCECD